MEVDIIKRPIRSFVRREGRITAGQQSAFDQWLDEFEVPLSLGVIDFTPLFKREAKVILEIGFGMGQSLVKMAHEYPEYDFIGIEVYRPGLGSLIAGAKALGLTNLKVVEGDAIDFLTQHVSDHSLTKLQLFFPDPWPKKRHHKRRIVQDSFLSLIHQKLVTGGCLHMATDWVPYAEHMHDVLKGRGDFNYMAQDDGLFPVKRPSTKFEQRGERKGHDIEDIYVVTQ